MLVGEGVEQETAAPILFHIQKRLSAEPLLVNLTARRWSTSVGQVLEHYMEALLGS